MCHTICGLKCGIWRTPPPTFFRSPKNTWGGYISRGQVKYFSEISCLTPPKYSRVKGGGYTYIICNIYNIHLKDMHVEATPHLHDILVVHLFNAGLPCMASARALDTTRPVASVTHWLPCEAVDSASDLSRRSHLLLLQLRGPYGVDCVSA